MICVMKSPNHPCEMVLRLKYLGGASSCCASSPNLPKTSDFCWLPLESGDDGPYHYNGIPSNPPMVCSEGVGRGNLRLLHRKAWLEVSDPKHRYGKHLRMYHRHWESLPESGSRSSRSSSSTTFFDWLDSQGAYAGEPLPEIPDCSRASLDSDTVRYIDDAREAERYAVRVCVDAATKRGRLFCARTGQPICTAGGGGGTAGWMFVLRNNVLYLAPKVTHTKQRFHHSSFFGGRAVQAAGIVVTCSDGYLTHVLPHSGHYRPGESDVQRVLYYLLRKGVCWTTFQVDVQQFLRIDRHGIVNNADMVCAKKKKTESLHLRSAVTVADFLSHKARCMQQNGIFSAIEARRV